MLDYSVAPSAWPAATCELSRAVSYVRKIADENNIDSNKIFVAGFSAGGHLAASIGVRWNHPDVIKYSGIEDGSNRPNGRHGLSAGDNITCPPGTGMPCNTSWIDMCIR